ncbi:MAG: YfiR family protein [Syntrophotaleaceae bacterium]
MAGKLLCRQNAPWLSPCRGDGPLQREIIAGLDGKQIEDRTIAIKRLAPDQVPDPNHPCHILYLSPGTSRRLASIMQKVSKRPILTVSDMQNFTQMGGILHLESAQNVAFSLNLDRPDQAGLVISSKLFRLAREVIRGGQPREGP